MFRLCNRLNVIINSYDKVAVLSRIIPYDSVSSCRYSILFTASLTETFLFTKYNDLTISYNLFLVRWDIFRQDNA